MECFFMKSVNIRIEHIAHVAEDYCSSNADLTLPPLTTGTGHERIDERINSPEGRLVCERREGIK
jgi:hypothetical protein